MTSGRVVEAQRTFQDHTLDATAQAVVGSGPAQPLLVPVLVVVKRLEQGSVVRLQRRRQRHTQPPRALVRPRRDRARDCAAVTAVVLVDERVRPGALAARTGVVPA